MTSKSTNPSTKTVLSLSALALLITGGILYAGPLNPPAGPVTPTFKTLAEVEPRIAINATNTPGDADSLFKITQRGSYYLTGNINGVSGKHGIEIAESEVSIDLNGFAIRGSSGALNGVVSGGQSSNFAIRNGTIVNWTTGIYLDDIAFHAQIESIIVRSCNQLGIRASRNSVIRNCIVGDNDGGGIVTNDGGIVIACEAYRNGISGISVGPGSNVRDCSANFNWGTGISTGAKSSVSGCTSERNIFAGIAVSDGSTVSGCAVNDNQQRGIDANNGCLIQNSSSRNNLLDGISVNFSCTVTGNNCNGDGTAAGNQGGIRVLGQANRVEGNNVTYADRGLLVDSGGNVIIRNTVKGCTLNWSIVTGNALAPIVSAATNAGAVNGDTFVGNLGSTDPNANFTY